MHIHLSMLWTSNGTEEWCSGYQVSGNLILPGEPLAKGYYKWHPEVLLKEVPMWLNGGGIIIEVSLYVI